VAQGLDLKIIYKNMFNQNRTIFIFIGLTILAVIFFLILLSNFTSFHLNTDQSIITEKEARAIAEKACIKGGEALSNGTYNENTKTWWFDANLNAIPEGCSPACVVSEENKTAEINWRCTGLQNPENPQGTDKCGIENCHGLDIVCGPNIAEMCTAIYMAGDNCRQLASCEIINGNCQMANSPRFETCKSCVNKCESDFPNDQIKFFECESKCAQ
jgi:hypothetical protein